MNDAMPHVVIHTDGACSGNPGPGGWGAILRFGDREKELKGGEPDTTNNRMELMAAIAALEALKRPCRVDLHTDSQYLRNGIMSWINRLEAQWLAHRRTRSRSKTSISGSGSMPRSNRIRCTGTGSRATPAMP